VSKTIDISHLRIAKISLQSTSACLVKFAYIEDGNTVYESNYTNLGNSLDYTFPEWVYQGHIADQIKLTFTSLYPIGSNYGVQIGTMTMQYYTQDFVETGKKTFMRHYEKRKVKYSPNTTMDLGSAPAISSDETLNLGIDAVVYVYWKYVSGDKKGQISGHAVWKVPASVWVENGRIKAQFGDYTLPPATLPPAITDYEATLTIKVYKTVTSGYSTWVFRGYDFTTTYNLWDEVELNLSAFQAVGSPTSQINTIRLVANGINYYDEIYLLNSKPAVHYVEVGEGNEITERTTDGLLDEDSATMFATALLNLLSKPIEEYEAVKPLETIVSLGDGVLTPSGDILPVYRIVWNFADGYKTLFIGRQVQNTIAFLKQTAERITALEKAIMS
jgi:hypothetical protein